MLDKDIDALLDPMKRLHDSGTNRSYHWRRSQLLLLKEMLTKHEKDFVSALKIDLNKSTSEARIVEMALIQKELALMLSNLKSYMKPEPVASPGHLVPCHSEVRREPLRSPACLIIGPFNYPLQLTVMPAIGSLAGGNPTIIKPSEHCPATSRLLESLVTRYFEKSALQVVQGGVTETSALLQRPWGLIFFTGSPRVGKIVAAHAAETLTPVVLELGGKSPTYVDKSIGRSRHIKTAADRIVWGKTVNAGQTCVAPDYVLCHEDVLQEFCDEAVKSLRRMYAGGERKEGEMIGSSSETNDAVAMESSQDLARVITSDQAKRLISLIVEAEKWSDPSSSSCLKTRVLFGGSSVCNPEKRYVAPTVVLNPPLESKLMNEEIFGPILPVLSVSSDDEAIEFITSRQRREGTTPLALYVFTSSNNVFEKFAASCPSAGIVKNDAVVQFSSCFLPVGGLGTSGYGTYHGRYSFNTFTHARAVVMRPSHPAFEYGGIRYAPFGPWKSKLFMTLMNLPRVPAVFTGWGFRSICCILVVAASLAKGLGFVPTHVGGFSATLPSDSEVSP